MKKQSKRMFVEDDLVTNKEKETTELNEELIRLAYNKGFQEGKAQTIKDIKEKIEQLHTDIDNWNITDKHIFSINQREFLHKRIGKLLSSIDNLGVEE